MKGNYIIGVLVLLLGCGSNSDSEVTDPYLWEVSSSFDSPIKSVEITELDELLIVTEKSLYYSNNKGQKFSKMSLPDSVLGTKVRVYEDDIYVIANYQIEPIDTIIFYVPVKVSALYKIDDMHDDWELLAHNKIMYDVLVAEEYYHIGTSGGVNTINRQTGEERYLNFFSSRLIDDVDEMIIYNNQILAGTHDGIYSSGDDGASWNRITEVFDKDNDDFPNLDVDTNNMLYAYRPTRIYALTADMRWHIFYLSRKNQSYYNYTLIEPELVLGEGYRCFDLLEIEEGEMANTTPSYCESMYEGEYLGINQMETFSNGDVAAISSYRLFVGTKNLESTFWQLRADLNN